MIAACKAFGKDINSFKNLTPFIRWKETLQAPVRSKSSLSTPPTKSQADAAPTSVFNRYQEQQPTIETDSTAASSPQRKEALQNDTTEPSTRPTTTATSAHPRSGSSISDPKDRSSAGRTEEIPRETPRLAPALEEDPKPLPGFNRAQVEMIRAMLEQTMNRFQEETVRATEEMAQRVQTKVSDQFNKARRQQQEDWAFADRATRDPDYRSPPYMNGARNPINNEVPVNRRQTRRTRDFQERTQERAASRSRRQENPLRLTRRDTSQDPEF